MNSIISKVPIPRLIARAPAAPIIIFFASISFITWLVFSCSKIELSYLEHYGYFFDPASYYLHNIDLYRLYQQAGLKDAVSYEITHNPRFPLRTIPYLLIAPHQLVTTLGHLWTEVPFIWLFLLMLMCTVYQRTRTSCFAITSSAVFLGAPYLYDPTLGIAGFWLDFTSSCALGCTSLCLVKYIASRNAGWMFAFGTLASAAALSRFSSAFYVLAYASLAVPVALLHIDWRRTKWQSSLAGPICALLAAAPGLVFLFAFLEQNRNYYSTYGYAFGAPIMQSILWTGPALVRLMGLPILMTLGALTTLHLLMLLMKRVDDWRISFIALWLPISIFLFVCVVVKAVDGWHCLVYFIPASLVSAFVPFCNMRTHHIWWRLLAVALGILAVSTTVVSYKTFRRVSLHPPAHLALRRHADSTMLQYILSTRAPSFIQFDTESLMPQLEAYLEHGFFSKWPSTMFSIHEAYMKNYFPNKSPEQAARAAFNQMEKEVALVAVFAKPDDALKPGVFDNPYSSTVARMVSEMVQKDSGWKHLGYADSPQGRLILCWNTKFKKAN